MILAWVLSHEGFRGNEQADYVTREGCYSVILQRKALKHSFTSGRRKNFRAVLSDLKQICGLGVLTEVHVRKKWSNICSKYKDYKENDIGQNIVWPHFEKLDNYFSKKTKSKLIIKKPFQSKSDQVINETRCEHNDVKLKNCRLCQKAEGIYNLKDDSNLCLRIDECTSLKIMENAENLPGGICDACKSVIDVFHGFLLQCRMIDKTLREIIQHQTLSKNKLYDSFNCKKCSISLNSDKTLKEHMNSHKKKRHFPCEICGMNFSRLSTLNFHMTKHETENKSIDEAKIEKEINVININPLIEDTKQVDFNSKENNKDECEVSEQNQINIIINKQVMEVNQQEDKIAKDELFSQDALNSPDCHVMNNQDDSIEEDEQNEDILETVEDKSTKDVEDKLYQCELCLRSYIKQADLKVHLKYHIGLTHACPRKDCNKTYSSLGSLRNHERKHLGLSSFLCVSCGKGFVSKSALKNHEKIHQEVKEYICDLCSRGFSVMGNLKTHQKKHHQGHRFYCSQCPKAFLSKNSLERHELVHTGIKEFVCNSCNASFYTNKELVKHQRYHQGVRLYHCNQCFKSFFEKHHLTVHMRSHTGERPYICTTPGCEKSFRDSQKLKRHLKMHH